MVNKKDKFYTNFSLPGIDNPLYQDIAYLNKTVYLTYYFNINLTNDKTCMLYFSSYYPKENVTNRMQTSMKIFQK